MGVMPQNFGSLSGFDVAGSWDAFIKAAGALRERLGANAFLADRYIGFMLGAANSFHSESINADGFDAGRDLYGLCQSIVNGECDKLDHPFYETASTYINAHPLPGIGRHALAWTYFVPLFGTYMEYSVADYAQKIEENAAEVADDAMLEELRHRIIDALDGDKDALYEAMIARFSECFAACSTLSSYLNGATYQMIEALSSSDRVTGRCVFQVLLDHSLEPA